MPAPTDPLTRLNETIRALPAADVREPSIPMAAFNQQGNDVVAFLEQHLDVKARLLKVGLPRALLDALPLAVGAAQAAESAWQAVFSPRRPEDVAALEERAARLRAKAISALRWNLRKDRIVQGTLDAIQEGHGAADLAQDLEALATLVEQHEGAFERDETFDAKERALACRQAAKELRDGVSGVRANLSRQEAKDLRDRAYTYADDLLDEVRSAARYAFEDEPELLVHFQDRYMARAARRFRKRAQGTPEPVDG